jgi:3-methyladenine DNA glycosylase AlkD
MNSHDPMTRTKEEYTSIIDKIKSENSSVGIDAQYTHAIVITYLQQIAKRLDAVEEKLKMRGGS